MCKVGPVIVKSISVACTREKSWLIFKLSDKYLSYFNLNLARQLSGL